MYAFPPPIPSVPIPVCVPQVKTAAKNIRSNNTCGNITNITLRNVSSHHTNNTTTIIQCTPRLLFLSRGETQLTRVGRRRAFGRALGTSASTDTLLSLTSGDNLVNTIHTSVFIYTHICIHTYTSACTHAQTRRQTNKYNRQTDTHICAKLLCWPISVRHLMETLVEII